MTPHQQPAPIDPDDGVVEAALWDQILAGFAARHTAANEPVATATQHTADARQADRVRASGARS